MIERFRPFRFSRAGIRGLKASATPAMKERVREIRNAGGDVLHLGFGESRVPIHPQLVETLRASVHHCRHLPAGADAKPAALVEAHAGQPGEKTGENLYDN